MTKMYDYLSYLMNTNININSTLIDESQNEYHIVEENNFRNSSVVANWLAKTGISVMYNKSVVHACVCEIIARTCGGKVWCNRDL